mgnify:CR=1 FL=1
MNWLKELFCVGVWSWKMCLFCFTKNATYMYMVLGYKSFFSWKTCLGITRSQGTCAKVGEMDITSESHESGLQIAITQNQQKPTTKLIHIISQNDGTVYIHLHLILHLPSLKMSIESHNLLKCICFLKIASRPPVKLSYWPHNVWVSNN